MKNIILFILAFVVIGCAQPVLTDQGDGSEWLGDSVDRGTVIVMNSLWQHVPLTAIHGSRASTPGDIQEQLDAYNAVTFTDFYWAYQDQAPSLDDAPPATVYFCDPETEVPTFTAINVPRRLLVENYEGWMLMARYQHIYIDHIPPSPVLDKVVNPYTWYAAYLINDDTGLPIFEDHCGYSIDQSFDPSGISDYPDVDRYFEAQVNAYRLQSIAYNATGMNTRVVSRQLYFPPGVSE